MIKKIYSKITKVIKNITKTEYAKSKSIINGEQALNVAVMHNHQTHQRLDAKMPNVTFNNL